MPIWGFIFILAAAIVFAVITFMSRSLIALGWALLAAGLIFTYATTGSTVHF